MKKIIILFVVTFSIQLSTFNCFAQWYQQNSGTTAILAGIHFVNANTGIAVGDSGIVLRTTNGGLNWFRQNSATNWILLRVQFVNANSGTAVGTTIIHTTNGGATWVPQSSPIGGLEDLKLIDENVGYAVGLQGIIKTTNGGATWFELPQNVEPAADWYGVDFVDANTGWAVGEHGIYGSSPIIKTTNGGLNWTEYRWIGGPSSRLNSVSFANALSGVIVGENPICITTNGGANWIARSSFTVLRSVQMLTPSIGYAAGFQRIQRTTDGGFNWTYQTLPVNEYFMDVSFIDTNTGWIVGFNGVILHTTNGGISGIQPIGNRIPEEFRLYQNYPNPFNPTTKIKFDVSASGPVSLSVYDMLGREIMVLVNENLQPGTYQVEFDGVNYAGGVYFYRLRTEGYVETRKMMLSK